MKFSQSRFTIKYTELHKDAHQFQLRFSFEPPNTIYLYYYQYKRGPHINMLLLSCFSHVRLCATPDGSPPGSSVPGILQARTLEWVAISFSNAWKWKVKVKSLSRVTLTTAYQALHPWDFPGKSTGVGCHCLLRINMLVVILTTFIGQILFN